MAKCSLDVRALRAVIAVVLCLGVSACGGLKLGSRATDTPTPRPQPVGVAAPAAAPATVDPAQFYRAAGLIAQGAPLPFVGSVSFVAAATSDSTHALVAFALSTSSLTFRREGDQHRGDYRVTLALKRGESVVSRMDVTEAVRVATLRETVRMDESILFQQQLTMAPGDYSLSVAVRDEFSGKLSTAPDVALRVPSFSTGSLTAPVPFYEAEPRHARDSALRIVASPRRLATFGRDSTIDVYLESYGTAGGTIDLAMQADGVGIWRGSATLEGTSGGVATAIARIPIANVGVGSIAILAWRAGQSDTVRTPAFVSIGDEVAATTYDAIISHLRYFGSENRLKEIQSVPPAARGAAWAKFFRETDPNPGTPDNEALRRYLGLLRDANARFADESPTPGWLTDRGMVWLLLGPCDQVIEPMPGDATQRGRTLVWEYRSVNVSVEFYRMGGAGQYRLTQASETEVRNAARRMNGSAP